MSTGSGDVVGTADRGLLVNVAYRLLGSVAEAEDAVQEAYARWYALPDTARAEIASPTAWLVTVVSRVCLDVLASARVRRERYVGEWLPEPVPGTASWTSVTPSAAADPAELAALDESLNMAMLVVLERMTPAERVAFVLHDVFRYTFAEVSAVLDRSPQACRQLAASARRRIRTGSPGRAAGSDHAGAVSAFKSAWETGDLLELVRLLDPAAAAVADGGGLASATPRPVVGAEAVAKLLFGLAERHPGVVLQLTTVNGRAGLVVREGEQPIAVVSFDVVAGRIQRIWAMRNPRKLTGWEPASSHFNV